MRVLGISAWYHDAAAAAVEDGRILAAAQEERFSRVKQDPGFPVFAAKYCLEEAGWDLCDVDRVAFYDKPFSKFERLLETYHWVAPRGLPQFLRSMPVWLREKLFAKRELRRHLAELGSFGGERNALLFSDHHLSHAASAFYPSPFEEAAIVTLDGVGEWSTATIQHGRGSSIRLLRELRFPHSVGLLYSAFTQYLGFKVNSGEYKLMGLAPYGDPDSSRTEEIEKLIREKLVAIGEDGGIVLNLEYFDYLAGLSMIRPAHWTALFGFPPRTTEDEIEPQHCDFAYAAQKVTEDIVLRFAHTAQRLTQSRNLCMAGGVALNCTANGLLLRSGIFDEIWIQPAAGDAGGALGAALAACYLGGDFKRDPRGEDGMQGSLLGPEWSDEEIRRVLQRVGAVHRKAANMEDLVGTAAEWLAQGRVTGWFQGRMEWGPRALGNRSILADPRDPKMQRRLNLKIKGREGFRPFAPIVLQEKAADWFEVDRPSPYMLFTAPVREDRRLPKGGASRRGEGASWRETLLVQRSEIPAVTHVDDSARLQTVGRENPRLRALLEAFERITGVGVLINTSFNVRGEPIVCTPMDAWRCFRRSEMDGLVLGSHLLLREEQPHWEDDGLGLPGTD